MDKLSLSDWLSIATITITIIIGVPAFYIGILSILRRRYINRTWNKINIFFDDLLVINQWNNNSKFPNERIKEYIDILISQGLLWFSSFEIINAFFDPYKYSDFSIYQIKDQLEKQDLFNIRRIYKKWKWIEKKNRICVQKLLDFEFVVNEKTSLHNNLITYNLNKFFNYNNEIKIKKTSISLIKSLDILRLFSSKNGGPSKYNVNKINLIKLNENSLEQNRKSFKELKNNSFIFNIRFWIFDKLKLKEEGEEENELNRRSSRIYSIHFNENHIITWIETIFDWNTLYKIKDEEELEIMIKELKIIKNMFNIENINDLIFKHWDWIDKYNNEKNIEYLNNHTLDGKSVLKIKQHFAKESNND